MGLVWNNGGQLQDIGPLLGRPPPIGNYYMATPPGVYPSLTTSTVSVAKSVYWQPWYIYTAFTSNAMGAYATSSTAGNMYFAIYAASKTNGLPTGSPLQTGICVFTAAANQFKGGSYYAAGQSNVKASFTPGLYWIAITFDTSGLQANALQANSYINAAFGSGVSAGNVSSGLLYYTSSVTTPGSTPSNWPTNPTLSETSTPNNPPAFIYNVYSVP